MSNPWTAQNTEDPKSLSNSISNDNETLPQQFEDNFTNGSSSHYQPLSDSQHYLQGLGMKKSQNIKKCKLK